MPTTERRDGDATRCVAMRVSRITARVICECRERATWRADHASRKRKAPVRCQCLRSFVFERASTDFPDEESGVNEKRNKTFDVDQFVIG